MSDFNYILKKPLQLAGELITELNFRAARAGDLRAIHHEGGKAGFANSLDMAAKLSNQPPSVLDMMSIEDGLEVINIVGKLFQDGLETSRVQ